MRSRLAKPALLALLILGYGPLAPAPAPGRDGDGDPLKRRAFLGTRLEPLGEDARDGLELEPGVGVAITEVIPGSTAEAAGIEAGDVLVAVGEAPAASPAEVVRSLAGKKAGDELALTYLHDGERVDKTVALRPLPFETSEAYEVEYGAVESRGARLRTIATRPPGDGPFPGFLLIQGVGTFSVDNPTGTLSSYRAIIDALTRAGFVTLRVDKPGCGDSEGGPADRVDFEAELDGYRQALRALKARADVDPERVVIFGHSMGGVMGPLLAREEPVKGLAVYGTVSVGWIEYMLPNSRRQMALAGASPGAIDRAVRLDAAIHHYVYYEKLTPEQVAAAHPELRDRLRELYPEGDTFVGRTNDFFRQLADRDLGDAWDAYPRHVLAVWGVSDFVSAREDHERIAAIVDHDHPGHGRFVALADSDHGFLRYATPEESFAGLQPGAPPGAFNPAILELLRDWSVEVAGPTGPSRPD